MSWKCPILQFFEFLLLGDALLRLNEQMGHLHMYKKNAVLLYML